MFGSRFRLALPAVALLAGCHWVLGHAPAPPGAPDATALDTGGLDRREELAGLERARAERPVVLDRDRVDAGARDAAKPDVKLDGSKAPDAPSVSKIKLGWASPLQQLNAPGTSWLHPVSCAGSGLLVVGIAGIGATITSVTASAAPLTKWVGGGGTQSVALWRLAGVTGTVTVEVTGSGEADMGSATFCGATGLGTSSVGTAPGGTGILAGTPVVDVVANASGVTAFTPSVLHEVLWSTTKAGMGWSSGAGGLTNLGWTTGAGMTSFCWAEIK